jgi:hypothetical protein
MQPEIPPPAAAGRGRWLASFDWGYVVVGLLPLVLLLPSSAWLFPGELNTTDSWLYYAYMKHPHQELCQLPERYFGDRLTWILPGALAHRLLPPTAAHVALKLTFFVLTLLAFYGAAKAGAGRRAALLATLLFGCYPFTLASAGWYYVDVGAVCYFLLALCCLLAARRAETMRVSWAWSALAGALVVAMVVAYIKTLLYGPTLLAFYALGRGSGPRLSLARCATQALGLAVGAGALVGGLFLAHHALAGDWNFFQPTLRFALGRSVEEMAAWQTKEPVWALARARWLVLPVAISLGSSAALLIRLIGRGPRPAPLGLFCLANAPATFAALVLLRQEAGSTLLDTVAYPFLLAPAWFLGVGPVLEGGCARLSRRGFAAAAGLCLAACALPMAGPCARLLTAVPLPGSPALWLLALAGYAVAALWPRRAAAPAAVVLALAGVVILGPLTDFAPSWHKDANGRHGFTGMVRGLRTVRRVIGDRAHTFWFDRHEPLEYYFRSFGSADLSLLKTGLNDHAPEYSADDARCVGLGTVVIALSGRGDELATRARQRLEGSGVHCRLLHREELAFGSVPYTMTFLETVQTRYEAERSPTRAAPAESTRDDPYASGGAYRFAPRGSEPGVLVFGPYVTLQPGRYRLDYRLCTDDCAAADVIACEDVVTAGGDVVLAGALVRGTDFAAPHTFQTFSLAFDVRKPTPLIEFRVHASGKAGVGVDYIELQRR